MERFKEGDDRTKQKFLKDLTEQIEFHEEFEEHVFYPTIRSAMGGSNLILTHASDEHAEIRGLLTQLLMANRETSQWRDLLATLDRVVRRHIQEEEDKLFPATRPLLDEQTAEMLGRQYEQMSDVTSFIPALLHRATRALPVSLDDGLELGIDNISPTPRVSTGSATLYVRIKRSSLYPHLSSLTPLFLLMLHSLTMHGLDAVVMLCDTRDRVLLAFTCSPSLDHVFVDNDYDNTPISRGTSVVSLKELPGILRDISVTASDDVGDDQSNNGSVPPAMSPRNIAQEVRQMQSLKFAAFIRARNEHLAEGPMKQHIDAFRCL